MELPKETENLAEWADLSPAFATMERGKDGTLYFVAWRYGLSKVLFAASPDGTIWKADDD